MNRTLNQGRHDANPKVEKKEKELNLISTERVSFSQWARFMAFKSENIKVENTDFLIVTSSSFFGIKKLYRKIPIMVFQKKNERDMLFYRDNRIWNLCVPVMMQDTRELLTMS